MPAADANNLSRELGKLGRGVSRWNDHGYPLPGTVVVASDTFSGAQAALSIRSLVLMPAHVHNCSGRHLA
jgi:hypothetical protein